jgi:uncharacterized protein YcbX
MIKKIKVTQLWIYPVKSLGGIKLPSAQVLPKGLEFDRRWMLIDEENRFMTQRRHPQMALFKVSMRSESFMVRRGQDAMMLSMYHEKTPIEAWIWNDRVTVFEVSEMHSLWFSDLLGVRCRLVVFPEDQPRSIDPAYAFNNEQVSLADGYPILLIGQSSLDDVNRRLETAVPMNRFRPNIVVEGGAPFEEDTWKRFRIGSLRMSAVKPCARCVLTTVDQETGVMGTEPLATLSRYRSTNNKVYFGQNILPLGKGQISIGDEIVVET